MPSTSALPRKLYLLPLGTATVPLPDGRTLDMVSASYLVELADGRHILIDTGLPADVPLPPGTPPAENEQTVLDHLTTLGLRPDDVDLLICTHFDVDHAGHHDAFATAELVVQRDHYELARAGHPRFAAARAHWDHPPLRYRLVDGDAELVPGVTLLATGGHAPGHQSVLVQLLRTGPVLLAIDAVMLEAQFVPGRRASPADDDEEQLRASTRKLLDLVARDRVGLVVFGHDGRQWRGLKTTPQFYD